MKDTQKVIEDLAGNEVPVGIFFIEAVETKSYNLRGSLSTGLCPMPVPGI